MRAGRTRASPTSDTAGLGVGGVDDGLGITPRPRQDLLRLTLSLLDQHVTATLSLNNLGLQEQRGPRWATSWTAQGLAGAQEGSLARGMVRAHLLVGTCVDDDLLVLQVSVLALCENGRKLTSIDTLDFDKPGDGVSSEEQCATGVRGWGGWGQAGDVGENRMQECSSGSQCPTHSMWTPQRVLAAATSPATRSMAAVSCARHHKHKHNDG